MAWLALGAPCRAAGDRPRMASALRSSVLDLEGPTSHGPSGGLTRCPRVNSRDVYRKSTMGAPRIHGELLKLRISVSESTVATYMRRHPRPPSQTWRTFLTNHASQIMAADLFVVPTSHIPGCSSFSSSSPTTADRSRISEGIVCGAQRGITRGFRGGRQAFCIVFVSTFR